MARLFLHQKPGWREIGIPDREIFEALRPSGKNRLLFRIEREHGTPGLEDAAAIRIGQEAVVLWEKSAGFGKVGRVSLSHRSEVTSITDLGGLRLPRYGVTLTVNFSVGPIRRAIPAEAIARMEALSCARRGAKKFLGGEPLIFADWLEERGDLEAAERIRAAAK